jgi:Ca2+/Na+ antiporter
VVLPPIICALLCFVIFYMRKMDLDRKSSVALIVIYTGYVVYSVADFYKDE